MKYFFPKLRSGDKETPEPAVKGVWIRDSQKNLLETLPKALDISGEVSGEVVSSIPSVFARPLLFSYSLFSEDSPVQKYSKKEWRGILGLFCFKELENINLEIERYEIDGNNSPLERHLIETGLNGVSPLYLVKIDKEIVAVSFPYCIFFTPAEYNCPESIPWNNNGKLSDPTEYYKNNRGFDKLIYLYNWINYVREAYGRAQLQGIFEEHRLNITKLLQEWQDEIKTILSDERRGPIQFRDIYKTISSVDSPYNYFTICIDRERAPEERYFTRKILKLNLNKQNALGLSLGDQSYTIPITKTFIDERFNEDFPSFRNFIHDNDNITIEEVGNSIEVTIRLDQNYTISKRFTNNDIIYIDITPIIEIWPAFKEEDWNLYYVFCHSFGDENLTITPDNLDTHRNNREYKLTSFPNYLLFRYKNEEAGIIVPNPSENLLSNIVSNRRCIVGVDFGTSNTNIYIKEIEGQERVPEPIKLNPSLIRLTNPDPTERTIELYRSFFPPEERVPDFPTLFRAKNQVEIGSESVLDGIAYIDPDIYSRWETSGLKDNIKWIEDSNERIIISLYLKHLLMMIKEECRKRGIKPQNIEVRWAYPSEFRKSWIEDLSDQWKIICSDLGISSQQGTTENVALVKYFISRQGATVGGINPHVFVDIGGGSTDISLWRENRLLLQTSIKLAGNDIIGRYSKKQEFLRLILESCITDNELVNKLLRLSNSINPSTLINVILANSEYLGRLGKNLPTIRGDKEIKNVNTIIYIFLSGILYYIGLLLAYKYKKDNIKPLQEITIWLAGKGSKMVDWLSGNIQSLGVFVSEPFKSIFSSEFSSEEVEVKIEASKEPKSEVALGLTSDYQINGDIRHLNILGENIEEFNWNKELESENDEIISELKKIQDALRKVDSFDYFDSFRNLLVKNEESYGINDISEEELEKDYILSQFGEYIGKLEKAGGKPESFFIFELRLFLEKILKKYFNKGIQRNRTQGGKKT